MKVENLIKLLRELPQDLDVAFAEPYDDKQIHIVQTISMLQDSTKTVVLEA
jgi:hypothetical protein